MEKRRFGRLGWKISPIGYGMWGIAGGEGGWTGADEAKGMDCLHLAVDLGCTFFDTAWIYGRGVSERMLGRLLRERPAAGVRVATKIPPKSRVWPSKRGDLWRDVFPREHCEEYLRASLDNLGVSRIDLIQFHVWEDSWTQEEEFLDLVERWKREGLAEGVGLSLNRWEPWNGVRAVETGLIDAVQVIYNIFDQSPEDELLPACRRHDVAVIARVPFDEGTLTGTLTHESRWPEGDWRNTYFVPENLHASVERAERLAPLVPPGSTMPEMALRFILANPDIATTIPGMRNQRHVSANMACADGPRLAPSLLAALKTHRWDRQPTWWSQ